jgi:orotidine-5'-phosphate decarboxylase
MDFLKKLKTNWNNGKFVCIGLDPVSEKLPNHLKGDFFKFNKAIIDETADLVLAYKPNSAFYEAEGALGIEWLKKTCDYINKKYPNVPIILDAKRADIGSTNEGYVKFIFDYLGVDAATLHPYLGREALAPFLARKDKGILILAKTSNPGAGEFQNLSLGGKPLYIHVAKQVANKWNTNGNLGFVVGATYPEELANIRKTVGDMPILIPGIGTQGGDLKTTLKVGLTQNKQGVIISSSRAIIFASQGKDFADVAREETLGLHREIQKYL